MNNSEEAMISEVDARAIVDMLAKVAIFSGSHIDKKRLLLDLLGEAIGADKWLAAYRVQNTTGDAPRFVAHLFSGFEPEQLVKLSESAAHPCLREIDKYYAEELLRKKSQVTLRLEDFDKKKLWPGSPAAELASQAGVGTFVSCTRPVYGEAEDDIKSSVVALYRAPNVPLFTERERRIAHIVLTEVSWLHTEGWPEECHVGAVADLSRSHLVCLNLLISGHSRQEIAEMMALSLHTVNSYVKNIFQHFSVSSQPQLMKRFIFGDGNDQIKGGGEN